MPMRRRGQLDCAAHGEGGGEAVLWGTERGAKCREGNGGGRKSGKAREEEAAGTTGHADGAGTAAEVIN